ncbi:hypothetical protein [Kitasatospora purpeofusca]|uniref:hypothetical protein n=1 Tax=Kitasatospora purpeofusca TaxID=67352 RepID=UPI0022509DBA|nr:hypothetical protein [Kitasatospora purpeofusca]MCX4690686.1 hypothetical protein [Kitasatospora purpeofusca]
MAMSGAALRHFIRQALATIADPPILRRADRPVAPGIVALVETRARTLQEMLFVLDPAPLLSVARTDLDLTTMVLTDNGFDPVTGTRLYLAASEIAGLCGTIHAGLGEVALAEGYYLGAIRAAASAGAVQQALTALANLALDHSDAGDPGEALTLLEAARVLAPYPTREMAAVLHTRAAHSHARLNDITASTHAMDQAASALEQPSTQESNQLGNVDEEWLSRHMGNIWLELGQPKRALEHFASSLTGLSSGHSTQPPLLSARSLLSAVDAYLALGEIDAAAHSTHQAVTLFHRMPPGLTRQYRQRLHPHRAVPAVLEVLERLVEAI